MLNLIRTKTNPQKELKGNCQLKKRQKNVKHARKKPGKNVKHAEIIIIKKKSYI